jgi:processive 1,2-diacylglycerol beta-glucosyltransferase
MYISEVSGHHSATLAIEKALRILEPQVEILNINAFNYTNPISEKVVNRLYMGVIKRAPKIWDYLYDNPAVARRIEKIKEAVHKYNSPKLKRLFARFDPDAVVCTQAFPCGMVADYKKTYDSCVSLVAVLTDYIPHSYWVYDAVNYYITPSEEVTQLLIKKGVAPDKIKSLGIPFDPKFNAPLDKAMLAQKLKLDLGKATILIMGGGQGLGPIKTIVKSLKKIEREFQVIVVTGTNKKLHQSLKKKIKKYSKKLLVLAQADNINELMGISDFIITKPGGVTTAEALAKNLPMVIIKPIPGQEQSNTAYLTKKQSAIKIDDLRMIDSAVEELLENKNKLSYMRQSAVSISKPNASLDIARLLLDL